MKSRGLVFVGPRCPWGPIYGSGSETPFADLTDDVTLADKDTNSILTQKDKSRAMCGTTDPVFSCNCIVSIMLSLCFRVSKVV